MGGGWNRVPNLVISMEKKGKEGERDEGRYRERMGEGTECKG